MTSVAQMVGSNRIITAPSIVQPLGNVDLEQKVEKAFRRVIVEKALEAVCKEIEEQTLFK